MHEDIICWVELDAGEPTSASLETLGEAAEIAQVWNARTIAVLLCDDVPSDEVARVLGGHGADCVAVVQHPALNEYTTDGAVAALSHVLHAQAWRLLLAPHSVNGCDLVVRVAAERGVELVSDCVHIAAAGVDALRLTRPLHGGRQHAHYRAEPTVSQPLAATLRPGARGLPVQFSLRSPEVQCIALDDDIATRVTLLGTSAPDPETVDLVEAERIVAVGLGLPYPAGLELTTELARCLRAAVGATRPVVDKGWLPFARQIGTTGRSVTPRLYIALGISGASQHTGGLRGAQTIIAINTDRSAPMMALADLAVVGDATAIVPLVIAMLNAAPIERVG